MKYTTIQYNTIQYNIAAITTRNLEADQWRNREEWRLVSGRRRQLLKKTGQIDR
jgi:hypothetical protein